MEQQSKTVLYENSSRNVSAVINNGIVEIIQTFGGKVEEIIPLGVEEVKMILNLLTEWEEKHKKEQINKAQ
ncbi:hypothetical protein MKZ20_17630 [Psychrobacillus sp. FSL K6-2684]|uniref:hypothetical protein n=1 Tax=Psychrobacillus sp. FSL K6-2684 TaxID=2921547 RepID=UPI0030F98B20